MGIEDRTGASLESMVVSVSVIVWYRRRTMGVKHLEERGRDALGQVMT